MKLQDVVKFIEIKENKFVDYALNPKHPTGKEKAYVFDKVLGYNLSNYNLLIQQIEKYALSV